MDIWLLIAAANQPYLKQVREFYFQAESYMDLGHEKDASHLRGSRRTGSSLCRGNFGSSDMRAGHTCGILLLSITAMFSLHQPNPQGAIGAPSEAQ